MRYVSLFSGIEAASVAWEPLGWEPVCFAELDEFPSAVLAQRYPGVPNVGDVTKVNWKRLKGKCDVLVGGSPCQSFSVAGKREGLKGESGLMFEYIRAVREVRPRWFLWENVPGALTSERGEAFRQLLSEMDALGYGMAWRVLDAQFFGVAQRRERVFLVGRLGERPPVEVLFDGDGLQWDFAQGREKRAELAAAARRSPADTGECLNGWDVQSKRVYDPEAVAPTLPSGTNEGMNIQPNVLTECAIQGSMIGRADANGPQGSGIETDGASFTLNCTDRHGVLAFAQNTRDEVRVQGDGTLSGALAANPGMKQTTYVCETAHTGSNGLGVAKSDVSPTISTGNSTAVYPINEQIATRSNALGRGTGLGVAEDGDPGYTLQAAHPHMVAECPMTMADGNSKAAVMEDACGTLKVGGEAPIMARRAVVRRLTPMECERLQGFPDNWTRIPYRGKPEEECPDTPRYKAIGNSMAVPVMKWIGERIALAEEGEIE